MKVKMIHAPMDDINNEFRLLPHGMSLVTAYLRKNGIRVDQDDLDMRIRIANSKEKLINKKINADIFNNSLRVKKYIFSEIGDQYIDLQLEKILKKVDLKGIDLVGFSLSLGKLFLTIALCKKIKELYDLPIVIGGPFLNLTNTRIMKECRFIDYGVLGAGEMPILRLCNMIDGGNITEKDIPGLLYLENNSLKYNAGNEEAHGNYRLIPDYDGLPLDFFRYRIYDIFKELENNMNISKMPIGKKSEILIIPFQFIAGCPHKCAFCTNSIFNSYNSMPVDKIVDSIEYLSKKYKTKYFFFLNCEINTNPRFLDELLEKMIKRDLNIFWSDSARLENLNKERFNNLREAGCIRLWYGVESASQRVLDFVGKSINVKKAEQILKLSHKSQIWNALNFIFGLPSEKSYDINKTLAFIKNNKKYIDSYVLNTFILNGLTRRYPEKYGITNVRFHAVLNDGCFVYAFDEIGGPNYGQRMKRTEEAISNVKKIIGNKHEPITSDVRFLFYFYSLFEGKNIKKEIYSLIRN